MKVDKEVVASSAEMEFTKILEEKGEAYAIAFLDGYKFASDLLKRLSEREKHEDSK